MHNKWLKLRDNNSLFPSFHSIIAFVAKFIKYAISMSISSMPLYIRDMERRMLASIGICPLVWECQEGPKGGAHEAQFTLVMNFELHHPIFWRKFIMFSFHYQFINSLLGVCLLLSFFSITCAQSRTVLLRAPSSFSSIIKSAEWNIAELTLTLETIYLLGAMIFVP